MTYYTPILAAGDDLMSHVLPHRLSHDPIFSIAGIDFYMTNHILMMLVAALLMFTIFSYVASKVKTKGDGIDAYVTRGCIAQLFETICVYIRSEVAQPALGELTDKYIKYIWTMFYFVLFCNLLGMIPTGPILRWAAGNNAHFEHFGGTATSNINITFGLACVSFFMIHFVGIRHNGWAYFKHFNPGPWWMFPIMVPIEIIGSFIKPCALAIRLFANMVGGHLALAALMSLIFIFKALAVVPTILGAAALSMLELFVAFLQAYIFTFLTVLFIAAGAVHEHEEHEEHEHEPVADAVAAAGD